MSRKEAVIIKSGTRRFRAIVAFAEAVYGFTGLSVLETRTRNRWKGEAKRQKNKNGYDIHFGCGTLLQVTSWNR
jgi:hypothetical protein